MIAYDTFELTISAVAIFAIFRGNSRSASQRSRALTAEAITRKTPAMLPNRYNPHKPELIHPQIQSKQTPNQCPHEQFFIPKAQEHTRRPPRETVAQQSRTSSGFLHPASNEFTELLPAKKGAWYTGAILTAARPRGGRRGQRRGRRGNRRRGRRRGPARPLK